MNPFRFGFRDFGRAEQRYLEVSLPFLIFAHLARCPAAIFALAPADMVLLPFRFPAAAEVADFWSLSLAQRALWAAAILARAAALNRPLPRPLRLVMFFPPYDPANAATAAFSPSSWRATLSRSALSNASMSIRIGFLLAGIVPNKPYRTIAGAPGKNSVARKMPAPSVKQPVATTS